MNAKALCGILRVAPNPAARLAVAETIKDVVMDAKGNPTLAGTGISSHPEMVMELGKALSPLLDAALQARDWRTPSTLQDLDSSSILMQAILPHLERCDAAKMLFFLRENLFSCLRASGLLTSLPKALKKADSVLVAPDSPAPTDMTCTQYISFLLLTFGGLIRHIPNDCIDLKDGDLLAPLLLPAAQLAADALRIYAGPDGARIMASNTYLAGYEDAKLLATTSVPNPNLTPAQVQQILQYLKQQAGRIACSCVIANALCVADTFSILSFNGYAYYLGPGTTGKETDLAQQVLGNRAVSRLVASMFFVMVKQLHTKQGGKAGAAAPATRSSGRTKTKQGATSSSSSAPLVPAHHNQLASVLSLDLLAADEELFLDVTRRPGPPPPAAGTRGPRLPARGGIGPIKADLTPHPIESILVDPLNGLHAILMHVANNDNPMTAFLQSTLLSSSGRPNVRVTAHFSDELSQAVLLTAAKVCALSPTEHGEDALRVSTYTAIGLLASFIRFAGPEVAGRVFARNTEWLDPSPNPLDHPDLQDLVAPVLKDLLMLLVPLLLPECHGIPLPGSQPADSTGSKLSGLLPQMVFIMAAAAGKDVLAQLLEEHPLWTTRALEAAVRVDWAERFAMPFIRSLLLQTVPAVLTSLGQPSDATAISSSAAAAAGPSNLAMLIASSSQRHLRLQVHALLTTVVKFAGGLNASALRIAAGAAAAPAPAASGSSSRNRAPVTDEQRAAFRTQLANVRLPPPAVNGQLAEILRTTLNIDINTFPAEQQQATAQFLANIQGAPVSFLRSMAAVDRVGQFRGSLELVSSAAAAAAELGRAVGQAAATSTTNIDAADSSTVPLTAPFVSLIGRCLHLTGTALEGASKEPKLGAAEFSSVSSDLKTLLSCLDWVVADTACCQELLASTGAADAAAVDSLRTSLQQQLAQLQGPGLQGQAVADVLRDSGLAGELKAVGGAMCGVVTGVCGNPACSSLSELSEIALVTPGGGKKGCGKCAACEAVSYCSRGCQVKHWKQGHKEFCNARKRAMAT